jgi:uncharacterized sporulation protein YeaH/YhbH (DUF444 family)
MSAALERQRELVRTHYNYGKWDIFNLIFSGGVTHAPNGVEESKLVQQIVTEFTAPTSLLTTYLEVPETYKRKNPSSTPSQTWTTLQTAKEDGVRIEMGRITGKKDIAPLLVPKLLRQTAAPELKAA